MLLSEISSCIRQQSSETIAAHWSGSGALNLHLFEEARQYWQKLLKFNSTKASQFLLISSGASWPNLRRKEKGMSRDKGGFCCRCGGTELEDDYHRYYGCTDNDSIAGINDSKHLCKFAKKEKDEKAIFLVSRHHA